MKTYKDLNNNLWAYEEDGSQDNIIPSDYILITEAEATTIQAQQEAEALAKLPVVVPPTKEELLVELQALTAKINALGVTP